MAKALLQQNGKVTDSQVYILALEGLPGTTLFSLYVLQAIDIMEPFKRLTLDIIGDSLFKFDFNALNSCMSATLSLLAATAGTLTSEFCSQGTQTTWSKMPSRSALQPNFYSSPMIFRTTDLCIESGH